MNRNFQRALAFTLKYEGGYVNHPADPGGHTNKGITLATLRRYYPKATVADLKKISQQTVAAIYRDGYWDKVMGHRLADGVDGATFDYAVTSGPAAALKSLRAVVGGPDHVTVKKLCARRLSIYRTFKHWATFGRGWINRVTAGEALWARWALEGSGTPVKPVLKAEGKAAGKRAASQGKGAGGAAVGSGGTASQVDPSSIEWANLLIGGLMIAGIVAVAYLLWRARINKKRAKAYEAQAEGA